MPESFFKCRIHTVSRIVQHLSAEPRTAGMLHNLSAGRRPAPASALVPRSVGASGKETTPFCSSVTPLTSRNAVVSPWVMQVRENSHTSLPAGFQSAEESASVCDHSSAAALGACASMLTNNARGIRQNLFGNSSYLVCGGSCRQPIHQQPAISNSDSGQYFDMYRSVYLPTPVPVQ